LTSQLSAGSRCALTSAATSCISSVWLCQKSSPKGRPGVLNINDGLLLWLEHLVYCALGGNGTSRMYGRKPLRPASG
jgi:exodeoxyribonuclease V gamma subunit